MSLVLRRQGANDAQSGRHSNDATFGFKSQRTSCWLFHADFVSF
jgi:hypothetical protein